jgi:hypothetical protein
MVHTSYQNFHGPFRFNGMTRPVDTLRQAAKNLRRRAMEFSSLSRIPIWGGENGENVHSDQFKNPNDY